MNTLETKRTASRPSSIPPGPKGTFLVGNALQVKKDPLGFLTNCAHSYGDVVLLRFGRQDVYLVNHPDYIKDVLVTESGKFRKTVGKRPSRIRKLLAGGEYLYRVTNFPDDDEFWPRESQKVRPVFHKEQVDGFGEIMLDVIDRRVSKWRAGDRLDIHREMMKLTIEVVATTLFGRISKEQRDVMFDAIEVVMTEIVTRAGNPIQLPPIIPTRRNRRLRQAVCQLEGLLEHFIVSGRSGKEERGYLIKSLLPERRNAGHLLEDPEWRFQLLTLFIAGYETPAVGLAWTWYLIARHPRVEAELRAELDTVLGSRRPTIEDYSRLRYTTAVFKESLRLYPPLWLFGARLALVDLDLGPYRVRAGTAVLISPWVTHRDPRYFEDPLSFHPERWLDEQVERSTRYTYIPFGAGLRRCIGSHFAMVESVMSIARISQTFRMKLDPGQPVKPIPWVGLRPSPGPPMELERH